MIKVLIFIFFSLCSVANAQLAGGLQFPGPGVGISAATYQGPGDALSGLTGISFYSCSEAWTAAKAASNVAMCQFSGVTSGVVTATCDLKAASNGLADLTSLNCVGNTVNIVTFCTVTNTSCAVSAVYNQINPGTVDVVQATLVAMPPVVFSSSPTGTLPAINCNSGSVNLQSAGTLTAALPITMAMVVKRTSGTAQGGVTGTSGNPAIGLFSSPSLAYITGGTNLIAGTIDTTTWHAISGLVNGNGTSSAINIDGSDTTGAAGLSGFGSNVRLCRAQALQTQGLIAEAIVWGTPASIAADRNNYSSNAHSVGRYNF